MMAKHSYISKILILGVLLQSTLLTSSGASAPPKLLLHVGEMIVSMNPTPGPNNLSNCVLVLPDGKFYLSLRREEIMDGTSTVSNFEGTLSDRSLGILRNIINEDGVKKAPPYQSPEIPFDADGFESFEVEIQRDNSIQTIGYFRWSGKGPANSSLIKKQWHESEVALQPLVEWFWSLKSDKEPRKKPVSKSKHSPCNFSGEENIK